ncbi:MAG TPA: thioredoxin-disulfide reductase [Chlamydiales bacterium]|nr:thioredoxin-disulfide reductase [Chlamydiales bacterium]
MDTKKIVIIGSGPAGFTAGIYTARANLNPLLIEGFMSGGSPGGQLMTTTDVENYPGFPDGILGPELMDLFKKQAERFGTHVLSGDVEWVDLNQRPFLIHGSIHGRSTEISAHALIIATGATAKRLDIEGARDGEFWQKGVSACAVCDGPAPIFRDRPLFVIGGGDSAVEEALFLTKYASRVFLVHRRNELRASKIMVDRVKKHPKIEILWNSEIAKIEGDNIIRSIRLKNLENGALEEKEAGGVFFAIGHEPNTKFLHSQLKMNETGYLLVQPGTTKTSVKGVFACGDVQDPAYRQAVTAAGSGCMAALDAERWLSEEGI